ncbi:heme peroxidase [Thozetella sp. PMI_491]|nr:heme peroxidase [Thozetella sp. PMI_491]
MRQISNGLLSLRVAFLCSSLARAYTWPNDQVDQLEQLLYEQTGPADFPIGPIAQDCSGAFQGGGQNNGAEWIRTAYHDMATADVATGTGGIDASIFMETDRAENPGGAFSETRGSIINAASLRSSMADLVALAATLAVGICSNGSLILPYRAGRVDATGPGPSGVPEPQEDLVTHTEKFAAQGFNVSEMIGLVACGHTVGGVHKTDFPLIVTDDVVTIFDSKNIVFDNTIAREFVANTSRNPLASGPNITTRSDERIFNADGGEMIRKMAASNDFFLSTCTSLLERMVNTVPKEVILSDIIAPIDVKPKSLAVEVNTNGTLSVSGKFRIDDALLADPNSQVRVHIQPRSGEDCMSNQSCLVANATTGDSMHIDRLYPNVPSFTVYCFKVFVPIEQGVSALIVEIVNTETGVPFIADNAGQGFPLSEVIQPQIARSTRRNVISADLHFYEQRNLTVAIRDADEATMVTLVTYFREDVTAEIPKWISSELTMAPSMSLPGTDYTLYNAAYNTTSSRLNQHPYDIVVTSSSQTVTSAYNDWLLIPLTA